MFYTPQTRSLDSSLGWLLRSAWELRLVHERQICANTVLTCLLSLQDLAEHVDPDIRELLYHVGYVTLDISGGTHLSLSPWT